LTYVTPVCDHEIEDGNGPGRRHLRPGRLGALLLPPLLRRPLLRRRP
jgi:hypothetical protein